MLSFSRFIQTRRQFLRNTSALGIGMAISSHLSAFAAQAAPSSSNEAQLAAIPRDTQLKFNQDGGVLPFAGNTVICHLFQQTRFHDAVASLADALQASSLAPKLAVLPRDSYHATIISGPNDQDRRRYGWPSDIPITTPIAECTRILEEKIEHFRMRAELPIRFRLEKEKTLALPRPCGVQLVPADANENQKLRSLRDQLADEVFHFRMDGHATFGFHISVAYQTKPLTPAESAEYQGILMRHLPGLIEAAPVIELGVPEFCSFEDMYRFEVLKLLRT